MPTTKEYEFLLSSISHEIRNPVTLINSYLQLLSAAHPEITSWEYWDQISSEINYLRALLTDISLLHNSTRLRPVPENLSLWLGGYETDARSLADRISASRPNSDSSIILRADIAPDLMCSFDPVRLRQALDNLIRNAAEAILIRFKGTEKEPGIPGRILLTAMQVNQAIQICISDNGCGLPGGTEESIFLPFESQKEEGTGLGLAIARQIIQTHGGALLARSSHFEGCRTDFVITLPLVCGT